MQSCLMSDDIATTGTGACFINYRSSDVDRSLLPLRRWRGEPNSEIHDADR